MNGSEGTTVLVGQPRVEAILERALAHDRVSHAYLFVGPANVGKSTAAQLLAQRVNCARPGEGLTPCGACESCLRIAAGTHPDVHLILPQSKSGQNVSVEQMRDTRRDAALRPTMGRRKVYVIPNAELMNVEAANTLLKTLEEPGDFVILILIAPGVESVLPTIQSRCQIVRFGLTSAMVIQAALEARFGLPAETAEAIARGAGGRIGLAFSWAGESETRERRDRALALLRETEERRRAARSRPGQQVAALRLAEAFRDLAPAGGPGATAAARAALGELLDLARDHYRDLLLLAVGAPAHLVVAAGEVAALREQAESAGSDALLRAIDTVTETRQFLERNVAPQWVLERMFARLIGEPADGDRYPA